MGLSLIISKDSWLFSIALIHSLWCLVYLRSDALTVGEFGVPYSHRSVSHQLKGIKFLLVLV